MPTPSEKKALLFIATVGLLGVSVRALRAVGAVSPVPASATRALDRQLEAVDSARAADKRPGGARRKASRKPRVPRPTNSATRAPAAQQPQTVVSPPTVAGPLDLDVATEGQIESLPGIGPVLAKRVVADRDARGAFGSIANLRRVSGIGPALAGKLAPVVTFSGTPRPLSAAPPDSSARRRAARPRRRPGT